MKTRLLALALFLGVVSAGLAALAKAAPEEEYKQAYLLIREANRLNYAGDTLGATDNYRQALTVLDGIQINHPTWKPDAIKQSADQCTRELWKRAPDVIGKYAQGLPGKKLVVNFIDVGQGDSTLIQCPNGRNILIDGGESKAGQAVVSYLRSRGIVKIDLLIATHPDADHIGGLVDVLEQYQVGQFIDPGKTHTTSLYENLLNLVSAKNIPYALGRKGDSYNFDEATMRVLSPTDQLYQDTNDCSVVIELKYGDIKFLLPGDAAEAAELNMVLSKTLSRCQILKAGHHGSSHSTTKKLLQSVKPEVAIISCGRDNRFGHPARETLSRLDSAGCEFYRTDEQGNIRVETDGRQYQVILEKRAQASPAAAERPRRESEKLNINAATAEQLQQIPRIGPVTSKAIVDYRREHGPFQTIEDIVNVSGIGPKTLERLRDRIRVPFADRPATVTAASGKNQKAPVEAAPITDGKLDINLATVWHLQELPGIGPAKAEAIVAYRTEQGPFKRIEDIVNVSGIGPKTLESLKDSILVTVEQSPTPTTAEAKTVQTPAKKHAAVESDKLDINSASALQLQELPGIGPVKAEAIVAYRTQQGPFEKIEDIVNVYGIGPKTLESLKDSICANQVAPPVPEGSPADKAKNEQLEEG